METHGLFSAIAETFVDQIAREQSVLQGQGLAATGLLPINLATGRAFFGVNALLLGGAGFADHRWLTQDHANELRLEAAGPRESMTESMTVMSWPTLRPGDTHRRLILAQVCNASQFVWRQERLGVRGVASDFGAEKVSTSLPPARSERDESRGQMVHALPARLLSRETDEDSPVVSAIASAMAAYVVAAQLGLPAPRRVVPEPLVQAVREDPTRLLRGATLGHRFALSLSTAGLSDDSSDTLGPMGHSQAGDRSVSVTESVIRSSGSSDLRPARASVLVLASPTMLIVDIRAQFRQALEEMGLVIEGAPVMDGSRQRVAVRRADGLKPRNRDGAYVGYLDGRPAGYIKNWLTGQERRWKAGSPLTDEHRQSIRAEAAANRARAERLREARYKHHARRSAQYLAMLPAARANHPYLRRKGIESVSAAASLLQDRRGNLVVSFQDVQGRVRGFQRIGPNGFKRIKKNVQKKGAFHLIGLKPDAGEGGSTERDIRQAGGLVLTEGVATGASVHQATGLPVAVAFDAYNLSAVALALRTRYPDIRLIIAADDDQGQSPNVGRTEAIKAAQRAQTAVVLPSEVPGYRVGQDFNDLVRVGLRDAVRIVIRQRARGDEGVGISGSRLGESQSIPVRRSTVRR